MNAESNTDQILHIWSDSYYGLSLWPEESEEKRNKKRGKI